MDQASKHELGKQLQPASSPWTSAWMRVDRSAGVRLPLTGFATNLLCGLCAPQLLPFAMKQLG